MQDMRMVRTLLTAVVLVPLAGLILLFALANRQWIRVSLDPFSAQDPALAVSLPLFFVVLFALMAGVFIGGAATWLSQAKWRRAARRHRAALRRALSESAPTKPRTEPADGASPTRSTALTVGYGRPPGA
jgi:uncharacterized integral membrane protein